MTSATTTSPQAAYSAKSDASRLALRWLLAGGLLLLIVVARLLHPEPLPFPTSWNLGLRAPIDGFQSWLVANRLSHPIFLYFFDPLSDTIDVLLRWVEYVLLALPWPVIVVALYFVAHRAGGQRLALGTVVGLLVMGFFGLWVQSMRTLALMGASVLFALAIGIPLGIVAAHSDRVDRGLRPLLDAMQTMPAFVYLLPVIFFFGIGGVPALVATVIYALPPVIRLTSLGIRQVPVNTVEAADAFGSTGWQKLLKVELPLAMPTILLGVNQTIMMALGIVVIAALIGAAGLGLEVLQALQRLRVGQGLEAGLAIVIMAVIFDRISYGFSRADGESERRRNTLFGVTFDQANPRLVALVYWGNALLVILVALVAHAYVWDMSYFPAAWRLSIRGPVDAAVVWMRDNLYQIGDLPIGTGPFSDFVTLYLLNPLRNLLQRWLAWPLVIGCFAYAAWLSAGWRLALGTMLGLLGLGLLGMWNESMDTLSQVTVAVVLSVIVGVPLGIWAAQSEAVERLLRPILDFLQTIPPFVYLVPVIMLFNVGRVPGVIASVLYALPPMIRLTNLGIRGVPVNTIEAADAFGSTGWQKLVKVQLPLALPSIMAGVNQTVMMVLAMVIVAGLVGGGALGYEVVVGLAKTELGRGVEAGIAIVLLAVVLDRITQAWGALSADAASLTRL